MDIWIENNNNGGRWGGAERINERRRSVVTRCREHGMERSGEPTQE